jgi:Fe-S cluster assembly protein SufD
LAEAVEEIEDETLREEITARLAAWLERHAA